MYRAGVVCDPLPYCGLNLSEVIWLLILAGLAASEIEARNDQHGESKKDKIRDGVYLTIFASLLSYLSWRLADVHPLKTIAVLLAVRVLYFDYRVSYLLIKNGVISGHWFDYVGKTSWFDVNVTSKVNPWLRLVLRVAILSGSIALLLI